MIQSATVEAGITVEESLLIGIAELNAQLAPGDIGPIGAVVGPVDLNPALDLTAVNGIFLAPGVGAQGASPADVACIFAACPERVFRAPHAPSFSGGQTWLDCVTPPNHLRPSSACC